eukprot:gnl/TRDRNA2_/TRDRNA2_172364_c0_seq1.p1 gnl/TRDRNA2_/TRDRNA2_172364_c0~~gnl/TRDRNA2_/TRDRNA2_172364_c0_seq1.p1  ORF type:complete len:163 (-),score=22.28 gnl/TRDRNA2_/TRDRNA2_172364_c0_seq1:235-723(-)
MRAILCFAVLASANALIKAGNSTAVLASGNALRKASVMGNSTAQIVLVPGQGGVSYEELTRRKIHEECLKHCTPEDTVWTDKAEAHCVSYCQAELFRCHDHNHTTTIGWPLHKSCTDAAIEEVKALANPEEGPGPGPSPGPAAPAAPGLTADQWEAKRRFKL